MISVVTFEAVANVNKQLDNR